MPLWEYVRLSGDISERMAVALIVEGRVRVQGRRITEPDYIVDCQRDEVKVGGVRLQPVEAFYVVFNRWMRGRCVEGLLPAEEGVKFYELFPVSRQGAIGLVLYTCNGLWAGLGRRRRPPVRQVYEVRVPLAWRERCEDLRQVLSAQEGVRAVVESGRTDRWVSLGVEVEAWDDSPVRKVVVDVFGGVVEGLVWDRTLLGIITKKGLSRGRWRHLTLLERNSLRPYFVLDGLG